MNTKNITLLATLLLLPLSALATPGFYTQAEVGAISLSDGNQSMFNFGKNPSGAVYKLGAGYLWGDDNFNYGIETDVSYLPHATLDSNIYLADAKIKYKGLAVSLLGVMKYTFDNGFLAFVKAGGAYVRQTQNATLTVLGYTASDTSYTDHKYAPEAALGIGYKFNPNWEADLTADAIFAGKPSATNANQIVTASQTITLGVGYHFG